MVELLFRLVQFKDQIFANILISFNTLQKLINALTYVNICSLDIFHAVNLKRKGFLHRDYWFIHKHTLNRFYHATCTSLLGALIFFVV